MKEEINHLLESNFKSRSPHIPEYIYDCQEHIFDSLNLMEFHSNIAYFGLNKKDVNAQTYDEIIENYSSGILDSFCLIHLIILKTVKSDIQAKDFLKSKPRYIAASIIREYIQDNLKTNIFQKLNQEEVDIDIEINKLPKGQVSDLLKFILTHLKV
jgi:hypothetical protein